VTKLGSKSKSLIEDAMSGLSGRAARHQAELLAGRFGVSIQTIYHHSKDVRPSRARRSDAGAHRAELSDEAIDYMIAMTHRADLPAELLAEIARNNGHPELDKVSTATVRRRLKERKASRGHFREAKDRKPRRRWEAARPNDLHQVDYTIMQQFYIDDDGGIGFESPLHRSKNKAGNKKPRLVLFALVDDHSRARYMRAYPGANTLFMLDFLHHAWSPKETHAFPFRGLPRVLYSDNDSIIKSHKFQRAAEALGVEVKTHFPGEPQAKGKVEAAFRWSKEMEKVTLISKFASLDEVNAFLWDRMLYYNNRRHSTTKVAPFARWLAIHDDELRETPEAELYDALFYDRFEPVVNKFLEISIKGISIQLPRRQPFYAMVGQRVPVFWHPRDSSRVTVAWEGKEYDVEVAEPVPDVAGQHRAAPMTETERQAEAAAGADLSGQRLYGWHAKKRGADVFIPRRGRAFDESRIETVGAERRLDLLEAIEALQAAGAVSVPVSPSERAALEALADEAGTVACADVERLAAEGLSPPEADERRREAG